MLNVQDATRSPQCSAMRRQWCSVWAAPRCCASPLVGKPVLQKVVHSGESSTRAYGPKRRGGRGGVTRQDFTLVTWLQAAIWMWSFEHRRQGFSMSPSYVRGRA